MGLKEYRRKRDFGLTPEPSGAGRATARRGTALSFVIQKHAARRLHYDFRLELDGVLKSWAVPKGPSLDPGEKRLAVHVEDHPLDYGGFEGIIPEGQYGGGTVMLWDRGTWQPEGQDDAAEAYAKGSLKFTLDGEKLHGKWALVRMGGRAAKERRENWLLIKERDAAAQPSSGAAVTEENPRSVKSGRDMDTIARDEDRVWDVRRGEVAAEPREPAPRKIESRKTMRRKVGPAGIERAERAVLPETIRPQLATAATAAPEGDDWLHEIKLDGYRILCRLAGGKAVLLSRNGLDWTARFPELAAALAKLPAKQAIIDGEVVRLEPSGRTSFPGLQQALSDGDTADLVYFAFDLLYLDGYDLTAAPLEARKAALLDWLGPHPIGTRGTIRYGDHHIGSGAEFFHHACSFALEGIVSKRRDAPYRSERSRSWLKIKCGNQDDFVIVGYSNPAGSRTGFGALILGYYDTAGRLRYAGRVGTGFDERLLTKLHRRLTKLATKERPVGPPPKGTSTRDVHWVRPELVAEIRFTEWTRDLVLRQAAFLGLREDKAAREVVLDPGKAVPKPTKPSAAKPGVAAPAPARSGTAVIAGTRLTRAEKVLYPEDGVTKGDLATYYERAAEWALPHLAGRPLSLLRCPEGFTGECFFQKHVSRGMPEAIRHVEMAEADGPKTMLYVEDAAGLVGLVQIGVLEIHPWGSTIERPELPDRLFFDLDPEEGLPWERIVEAALAIKQILADLGLASFAKTTGGKGLHVVVPLTPKLDWDTAKDFTKAAAELLVEAAPDRYTTTLAKKARHGKVFIDYLRNGRGQTAVGAFSTRARAGAPVSTPLSWQEVEAGIRSDAFSTATLPDRLAALKTDPWAGFFDVKQQVSAAVRRKLGL